ncbi:MAG: phage holin family protein [Pseudomonadota bacterium]
MVAEAARAERGTTGATVDVLLAARVLRAAGGALWDQARLHGELARIEGIAEQRRLARCAVFTVAVVVLLACASAALGSAALVLAWDTPWRPAVAIALPLVYAALAGVALLRLRSAWARASGAFAATRSEIAADLALLRSRL